MYACSKLFVPVHVGHLRTRMHLTGGHSGDWYCDWVSSTYKHHAMALAGTLNDSWMDAVECFLNELFYRIVTHVACFVLNPSSLRPRAAICSLADLGCEWPFCIICARTWNLINYTSLLRVRTKSEFAWFESAGSTSGQCQSLSN